MNYQAIYDTLILRAKERQLDGYKERHHILPKCMGGSNDASNLVDLTPEEHFLCHQLLVRIHKGTEHYRKMVYSVKMMTVIRDDRQVRDRSKLKMFGWLRREYSKAVSAARTGNPGPMLGKKSPWTSERNRKNKGTKRSFTEEHLRNLVEAISKPRSKEVKAKISATKSGVPRKKITCSHCGKEAGEGNFTRWHGDNCRNKSTVI